MHLVTTRSFNRVLICTDSVIQNITISCINPPPTNCSIRPQILIDTISANSYVFTNTTNSVGVATWHFSDSTSASGDSVYHTFNGPSPYSVCLRITESSTCYADTCITWRSGTTPSPCLIIPRLSFDSISSNRYVFVNTTNSRGTATWVFSDSTIATGDSVQHTFSGPSPYSVCLTITESSTCHADTCITLTQQNHTTTCPLQSNFSWQSSNSNPNEIHFTNTTSGLSTTDWVTWSFGDGTASNDVHPIHQYATNRAFNVCLSVVRDSMCFSNQCHSVSNTIPLTAYPNPAQNISNVNVRLTQGGTIVAYLYNSQSVLVGQISQIGSAGNNIISFNIASLPSGLYTIRIYSGTQVYVSRFQKL